MDVHTIIAGSPRILLLLWGLTLPFCAFAAWLFLYLANQEAPVAAGLLAGCFLVIGVTLLIGTIELTHHYLKHDAMRLTLTGEPPAVGKRLDGVIDLPASAVAPWVGVELACVLVTHERIDMNRTAAFEETCWSDKRQFRVQRRGRRGSAVVLFDIPDSLPPSGDALRREPAWPKLPRDYYFWELRVETGGIGARFRRALGVRVVASASRAGHGGLQTR
jgi:hypothetical protein